MAWRCFDVTAQYFEESFLGLKKKKNGKKEFIKPIECIDVLV